MSIPQYDFSKSKYYHALDQILLASEDSIEPRQLWDHVKEIFGGYSYSSSEEFEYNLIAFIEYGAEKGWLSFPEKAKTAEKVAKLALTFSNTNHDEISELAQAVLTNPKSIFNQYSSRYLKAHPTLFCKIVYKLTESGEFRKLFGHQFDEETSDEIECWAYDLLLFPEAYSVDPDPILFRRLDPQKLDEAGFKNALCLLAAAYRIADHVEDSPKDNIQQTKEILALHLMNLMNAHQEEFKQLNLTMPASFNQMDEFVDSKEIKALKFQKHPSSSQSSKKVEENKQEENEIKEVKTKQSQRSGKISWKKAFLLSLPIIGSQLTPAAAFGLTGFGLMQFQSKLSTGITKLQTLQTEMKQHIDDKQYSSLINNAEILLKKIHPFYARKKAKAWLDEVANLEKLFKIFPQQLKQQELEQIQSKQLEMFLDTPSVSVDKRILLHAVGDIFGSGTQLEGGDSAWMLQHFHEILAAKISVLKQQGLCESKQDKLTVCQEILQSQQPSIKLFEELDQKINKASEINAIFQRGTNTQFLERISREVEAISPGESFFFPGGWFGHAVVFEVIKQNDQKVVFRIYNTGAGVETYTPRQVVGTEIPFLTFTEVVDVPILNLKDITFLSTLQELKLDEAKGEILGAYDLYERSLAILGGKVSSKDFTLEETRSIQASGTCSYMSLVATYSQQLGNQQRAKYFDFESKLKAVWDYDRLHSNSYASDKEAYLLMKNGVASFAVELRKWHNEGILTDSDIKVALSKLHQIEDHLAFAKKMSVEKAASSYPKVEISSSSQRGMHSSKAISKDKTWSLSSFLAPSSMNLAPYKSAALGEWQPNGATILQDLDRLINMVQESRTQGHFLNSKEAIKELILKIPLQDPLFWAEINQKQAETLINALAHLNREFMINQAEISKSDSNRDHIKTSDYLMCIKLVSLADKAQRTLDIKLPSLYQQNFDYMLEDQSLYNAIVEPEWNTETELLRKYWSKKENNFYGLEKIPAGVFPLTQDGMQASWKIPSELFKYEKLDPKNKPPQLDWVIEKLRDPQIQGEIEKKYPQISKKTIVEQSIFALVGDADGVPPRLLPEYYFALEQISFFTNFVLTGEMHKLKTNALEDKTIRSFYKGIVKENESTLKRSVERYLPYKVRSWDFPYRSITVPPGEYATVIWSQFHLQQSSQVIRDKDLSSLFEIKESYGNNRERRKLSPNQIAVTIPQDISDDIKGMNVQHLRELLALGNVRELQLQETLGYFKQHPELLKQVGSKDLFRTLMMQTGLLVEELNAPDHSKIFLESLAEFCKRNYEIMKEVDESTAIFFIEINRYFADQTDFIQKKYPERFPLNYISPFFNSLNEIKELLPNASSENQYLLNKELIRLYRYKHDLTTLELADFIGTAIKLPLYYVQDSQKSQIGDVDVMDALRTKRILIEQALLGPDKDSILNTILQSIVPEAAMQKWKSSTFPMFSTETHEYAINVLKGAIYFQKGMLSTLPSQVYLHRDFVEHFGENVDFKAKQITPEIFEFTDSRGNDYRLKLIRDGSEANKLMIQRRFKDDWYQKESKDLLKNFDPKIVYSNSHIWVSANGNEVLITDPVKHTPLYQFKRVQYDSLEIERLHPDGTGTGLVVANTSTDDQFLNILARVEEKGNMIILQDKTGAPKAVELPRYGLSFSIEMDPKTGKLIAYSKFYEGYVLASVQGVGVLGDLTNYLILEKVDPDGKIFRKIIFPNVNFTPLKFVDSSLNPPAIRGTDPLNQNSFHTYNVDSKGLLDPQSEEARYFLAMVYMWKHDYLLAKKYLTGFGGQIQKLTQPEKNQLLTISTLNEKNKDPHPQAAALSLKAVAMLLRNEDDYKSSTNAPLSKEVSFLLYHSYPTYLENLEFVGEFALSSEEEVSLLRQLNPIKFGLLSYETQVVISNRIKHLQQQGYGIGVLQSGQFTASQKLRTSIQSIEESDIKKWHKQFLDEYLSTSETEKTHRLGKKTKGPTGSIKSSTKILRNTLMTNFEEYYRILRDNTDLTTIDLSVLRQLITSISGITSFPNSQQELVSMLQQILEIKIRSHEKMESMAAMVLSMVLKSPTTFPESEALFKQILFYDPDKFSHGNAGEENLRLFQHVLRLYQPTPLTVEQPVIRITEKSEELKSKDISGQCLVLLDLPFSNRPIVENTEDYLSKQESTKEERLSFTTSAQELSALLSTSVKETATRRSLDQLKAQTEEFFVKRKEQPKYVIKHIEALSQLKRDLSETLNLDKDRLLRKREEIVELINRPFSDVSLQQKREVRQISGTEQPMDLDEAIHLFLHLDTALFKKQNPALSDHESRMIVDSIRGYLETATYHQHLQKLIKAIDQIENGIRTSQPAEEVEYLIQKTAELMSTKRAYAINEHPEYLVFEYYMEMVMWQKQVDILDKLQLKEGKIGAPQHLGAAIELIMASGKSYVVLPIFLSLLADGNHISIGVLPDPLMASMARELQNFMGTSFKKIVEKIEVDREVVFDDIKLHSLYEQLMRVKTERKVLLMKSSSIQSLFLKFIEKLAGYVPEKEKVEQPNLFEAIFSFFQAPKAPVPIRQMDRGLIIFRDIFRLLKESGSVLLDEIDTILDVLRSFHYTIGDPKSLDPIYTQSISDLFLFLSMDPKVNQLIKMGFSPLSSNAPPFTKKHYNEVVKPVLIESILEGKIGGQDNELQLFLNGLNTEERQLVYDFLNDTGGWSFLNTKASHHVQDLLSIYKEEINELIPLTAQKNLNEHYGQDPNSVTAIPCHNGEPSIGSQFGTDVEVLNYSIQMHLQKGISERLIAKEIDQIKTLIKEEQRRSPTVSYKKLPSYQKYLRLAGKDTELKLFKLSKKDLEEITAKVNGDSQLKIELLQKYVLPEIKIYEKQLNADSQLFGLLFKHLQGMSGTLWNAETFSKYIHTIFLSDTNPKTLQLLWKNSPQHVHSLKTEIHEKGYQESIKTVLQEIYSRPDMPKGSFIDTGGVFKDIHDPADVAKELLNLECWKGTPIKGVAFYNSDKQLMVMKMVDNQAVVVELSKCGLAKEEIIAFWSQLHTTGSNILLDPHMTAAVSISRHTQLRDLLQSVWRLRGLDKNQRVNFIVSEEDTEFIKSSLTQITGKEIVGDLTLKDILLFLIHNQSQRQGNDNYRSFKQKMQAILIEKILSVIFDPSTSNEDVHRLFNSSYDLFATTQNLRPFELYGQEKTLEERKKVVESDINAFLSSPAFDEFRTNPLLKSQFKTADIENEIHILANEELTMMPDYLVQSNKYDKQRTIQVEQQKEKQSQKEKETKKQRAVIPERRGGARDLIAWSNKDLFKRNKFRPTPINEIRDKTYHDENPLILVNAMLKNYQLNSGGAFDAKLLSSLNLSPIIQPEYSQFTHTPFGFYQKQVPYALAIEDKESGEIRLMLLAQDDADQFKKMLIADQLPPVKELQREVRLALYHFDSDTMTQGSEGFDRSKFDQDPHLLMLKVQAKFFRGDSRYTENEMQALEQWLKANNPQELHDLFMDKILLWKDDSYLDYTDSLLQELFKKLGVHEK